jgi:hypothetical protein
MEWSIAGTPLPDLPFLYGPDYAEMHKKSNEIMRNFIEHQSNNGVEASDHSHSWDHAQRIWEGK